jgi:hypothetical protein
MAGFDMMGPGGMAGPMQPAGRMPSMPPSLSSPSTVQHPSPGNVDSRTILASPLADQMAGPMMQQQVLAQESKLIQGLVLPILMKIANRKKETDPKGSADMFKMIADLVKTNPPVTPPPTAAGGMASAASGLPQPGGPPSSGGSPPPPVGGTGSPLSGPMPGM